ncbi:MAG: hypothetical protein WCK60_00715 [Candidatus Nomurabacteria bacterium]
MNFINPESHVEQDNSPAMRFNNLILDLKNLPKGADVEIDEKRRIHGELTRIAKNELSDGRRVKALASAHEALEISLMDPKGLDEKYLV